MSSEQENQYLDKEISCAEPFSCPKKGAHFDFQIMCDKLNVVMQKRIDESLSETFSGLISFENGDVEVKVVSPPNLVAAQKQTRNFKWLQGYRARRLTVDKRAQRYSDVG